jgi:hypothetical protein
MSTLYYIQSSLPAISLWEKPEIDIETFLSRCSDWLNQKETEILTSANIAPTANQEHGNITITKWNNWETCLRNRIAKYRSNKLNIDATVYLKEEKDYFSELDRIVQEAMAAPNPYEKEKMLDEQRWHYLTSLEARHFFDIDLLCIYKIKLQLCEKWLNRNKDNGRDNFEKALDDLYKNNMLKIN